MTQKTKVIIEALAILAIIAALLLITVNLKAQKHKPGYWYKQAGAITCNLIAGFADGQAEIIRNDFRRYKSVHPNTNPQWSDPKFSFRNKYKNWPTDRSAKFPGSKTVFVFTTDKFHLNRTVRNVLMAGGLGVSMSLYEKPNWKQIVIQSLVSWGAFALGSGVAHAYYKPI